MSLLILFRKTANVNMFHKLLIEALDSGEGDEAIICSGFYDGVQFAFFIMQFRN
jgi:hypothetical protein